METGRPVRTVTRGGGGAGGRRGAGLVHACSVNEDALCPKIGIACTPAQEGVATRRHRSHRVQAGCTARRACTPPPHKHAPQVSPTSACCMYSQVFPACMHAHCYIHFQVRGHACMDACMQQVRLHACSRVGSPVLCTSPPPPPHTHRRPHPTAVLKLLNSPRGEEPQPAAAARSLRGKGDCPLRGLLSHPRPVAAQCAQHQ